MCSGFVTWFHAVHFLGSSSSLKGGIGSSRPGHDCGMSMRLSVWVAPDCVFKNFNVFQALRVASPFLMALSCLV